MAEPQKELQTVIQQRESPIRDQNQNQNFFNVSPRSDDQQINQVVSEPNFGDMARNFLIKTVPAIVVGVINTVREVVEAVQSSLAPQSQQQQQNPTASQVSSNLGNDNRNLQNQTQVPAAPTQIRQQNFNNEVRNPLGKPEVSAPLGSPQANPNSLNFSKGNEVNNSQTQTGNTAKVHGSGALNPIDSKVQDNQKKDLDAAIWLTGRFGKENEQGQKTLQIGDHTCIYDPKNKLFEVKNSSQATVLSMKDGIVQGNLPRSLTENIQQQQSAAITGLNRDSQQQTHARSQQQDQAHVR